MCEFESHSAHQLVVRFRKYNLEALKPKKYFKTVIRVEVLSEHEPVKDGTPLGWVEESCLFGECSGDISITEVTELTPREAAEALIRQGSDPSFFELDDEGNRLDDWQ